MKLMDPQEQQEFFHIIYQLIDIFGDSFVSLLTESRQTKDDLKLPTDDQLVAQIKGNTIVITERPFLFIKKHKNKYTVRQRSIVKNV